MSGVFVESVCLSTYLMSLIVLPDSELELELESSFDDSFSSKMTS